MLLRSLLAVTISSICLASAQAADLIVSAAASLTNAFREVGKLFEDSNAGHKVVFNFASSDVLLSQIAKGAPVDVFAAADAESMDRAEKQNLLAPGTRRILLRNKLVLIAPAGSSTALFSLARLQDPAVRRIAIGNPQPCRPAAIAAGRWRKRACGPSWSPNSSSRRTCGRRWIMLRAQRSTPDWCTQPTLR
jgi:molybdate transport system substrate-binding protein